MAVNKLFDHLDATQLMPYVANMSNATWYDWLRNQQVSLIRGSTGELASDGFYATSARRNYVLVPNETGSSISIYFCAISSGNGGPRIFREGSKTSMAVEYSGYLGSSNWFGVWKIGTLSASDRNTSVTFQKFHFVAGVSGSEYNVDTAEQITIPQSYADHLPGLHTPTYPGCIDISLTQTIANKTLVLGQDSITVSGSSTNSSWVNGITFTSKMINKKNNDAKIISQAGTSINYSSVLPHSLEEIFIEARTENFDFENSVDIQYTGDIEKLAPLTFVNGKVIGYNRLPATASFSLARVTRLVQVDTTRLPTISSIAGQKIDNHNSVYVMMLNGYDKITVNATVKETVYTHSNENYVPTFALYIGDALVGNYSPTSRAESNNVITFTYNISYGPLQVVPPVSLGTNQTFSVRYQGRFAREATANVPLTRNSTNISYVRFYNYVNPTWSVNAYRVNSSGVPDDRNGTIIKVEYSWGINPLDYSMSPHTGTTRPKIVMSNNQDTTGHNYNITTETGTYSYTIANRPLDKSYTLTMVLTDAAGRAFTLNCFVPSGEVFMDFRAGGSGLGIGKRAEADDLLSVGWDTEIKQDLQVDGTMTGPTITDIYDKLAKAGGGSISVTIPAHNSTGTATTTVTGGAIYKTANSWHCIRFPLVGSNSVVYMIASYNYSGTNNITVNLPYTRNSSYPSAVFTANISPSVSFTSDTQILIATGSNNTRTGTVVVGYFTNKNASIDAITGSTSVSVSAPAQTVTGTLGTGTGSGGGTVVSGLSREEVQVMIDQSLANFINGNNLRY